MPTLDTALTAAAAATAAPSFTLRSPRPDDAEALARVCFDAFADINARHCFPSDFPTLDGPRGLFGMMLATDRIRGVVAERDGSILGSAFAWLGNDSIAGIGPVTVDPSAQASGVGKAMMQAVLDHARRARCAGVRLVQAAFNTRSMSLYTKLGFDVREPLACMAGEPAAGGVEGLEVRPATDADIDACNAVCRAVHGHAREDDLRFGLMTGSARVVVRKADGRVTGYTTDVGFFGHAAAEGNRELMALIGTTAQIGGPGVLIPTRNAELFRWCLAAGLRVVQPMTLMSQGRYREPQGAFWPSILF